MNQGVINQIRDISEILPDINEIGFENWLDLFTIKTRLGNFFAPEQARLDSLIVSYMPFAQLCLLNDLLNFPLEERKNNKFFKNIILKNSPELTKYQLVIGSIYYPFWFSPLAKRVYLGIHSRLFKSRNAEHLNNFLDNMKDFVMDSLLSVSAKTYAPYNYNEIHNRVNSYYKGEKGNGNYVNWFLTFEIFRQIMNE
jgi:hypothetical protein